MQARAATMTVAGLCVGLAFALGCSGATEAEGVEMTGVELDAPGIGSGASGAHELHGVDTEGAINVLGGPASSVGDRRVDFQAWVDDLVRQYPDITEEEAWLRLDAAGFVAPNVTGRSAETDLRLDGVLSDSAGRIDDPDLARRSAGSRRLQKTPLDVATRD